MKRPLLLAGLLYVVKPVVAEKLLVSLYLVLFPLGARYAVRSIRRRATHLQAQRSKRLVHLAQTARADAEVAHAEPHEQWRDERIGCRLATHRHRPGVLACRAADETLRRRRAAAASATSSRRHRRHR